jgi:putative nucleotidyltransferase with HDIG domain
MSTLTAPHGALPAEIVRSITNLDPLPVAAQRLMAMLRGDEDSLAKIASVLETDQALVANLLRRANSARYAGAPIETVLHAVLRVGTLTVLDIVLDGHLRRLLTAAPAYGLDEHDLWLHGAASQIAVRAIRVECPALKIPAVADTAALLHDIGKLIISRYLKTDAQALIARAREQAITYTAAERQLLGFDHTAIGAAVAEHWKFPAEVAFAIAHHHDAGLTDATGVLDAVVLANIVAKTIGIGLGAEGLNFTVDPDIHARMGLTFQTFGRICAAAQAAFADFKIATRV